MPDIADQLDAAIGAAPYDAPALEPTLALGRRALRRRRLAYGVGTAATALVIGGTAWAVSPGDGADARDDTPIAEQLSVAEPWVVDEFVRVADDGTITVNPDADVLERKEIKDQAAVAFHLRVPWRGGEDWYLVVQPKTGLEAGADPTTGTQGLVEWASEQLDRGPVFPPDYMWVRFDEGSHLVPLYEGLRIVDQIADPGLGENFAAAGDPTAVAEVVHDGVTYFLAVRPLVGRTEVEGQSEAIPYRKDGRITTLEEYLDYARHQYATNDEGGSEGIR
jgi:hypothetical protein